jgi:arylsulfatase A-like enzyme
MPGVRNVLFIMCDQLRADHLGCYGHPHVATRNLDALARRGVPFERAFVQSGVCGPSRMSFYTGRYVSSHGAMWKRVPLSVGEVTLGEYLHGAGRALALVDKTHVMRDDAGDGYNFLAYSASSKPIRRSLPSSTIGRLMIEGLSSINAIALF